MKRILWPKRGFVDKTFGNVCPDQAAKFLVADDEKLIRDNDNSDSNGNTLMDRTKSQYKKVLDINRENHISHVIVQRIIQQTLPRINALSIPRGRCTCCLQLSKKL